MRIFIATTFHAVKFSNRIFLNVQHYYIIKRYHDNFGSVTLYARVEEQEPDEKMIDATDVVEKLIHVSSLINVLLNRDKSKVVADIENCEIVVGRLPSIAACRASDYAREKGKPFLAEIMGDAWDENWNHGVIGKLFAPYIFLKTKRVIANADFALYVTQRFLQERYPCKKRTVGVSNVRIVNVEDSVLQNRERRIKSTDKNELILVTTAAVDVQYKGQEYVIRAIPYLKAEGLKVKYVMIGDGDQTYLKSVAKQVNATDDIVFTGKLTMSEVFSQIDNSDLYIQPSLQEGLPRSVIEAMSRGCPCLGAKTAGIPELLHDEFIFKRKNVKDITRKILMYWHLSEEEKINTAEINYKESLNYTESVLDKNRNNYYEYVKSSICV